MSKEPGEKIHRTSHLFKLHSKTEALEGRASSIADDVSALGAL